MAKIDHGSIRVRLAEQGDRNWICSSMSRSLVDGEYRSRPERRASRLASANLYAERVVAACEVLIAESVDTPDLILGWVAVRRHHGVEELHYVHVRQEFRGLGICGALLDAVHLSDRAMTACNTQAWRRANSHNLEFAPWLKHGI